MVLLVRIRVFVASNQNLLLLVTYQGLLKVRIVTNVFNAGLGLG